MRWPLSYGSSSCVYTWLRATLLLPWNGWTQPSSAPCPSAASSALPPLWQLANRWVQEEPDIEGQNLSGNVIIVFETWDFFYISNQIKTHSSPSVANVQVQLYKEHAVFNSLSVFTSLCYCCVRMTVRL